MAEGSKQLPVKKAFDLDAVVNESDETPFDFTWGGTDWTLAHLAILDVWPLVAGMERGDEAAARAMLATAFGDQWDKFQKIPMPRYKLDALMTEYLAHCGVAPGELPASTSS